MEKNIPDLSTHLSDEIEALKAAYAAINRNDIPGFVKLFDAEIEMINPPGWPDGNAYRGIEAVTAHSAQARGTWAEGTCEPQRFITAGDKVIVCSHVRVRLKNEAGWIEGPVTDVITFRKGKVIQYVSFADEKEGFRFAGVKSSESIHK